MRSYKDTAVVYDAEMMNAEDPDKLVADTVRDLVNRLLQHALAKNFQSITISVRADPRYLSKTMYTAVVHEAFVHVQD